jgi:hypothetical protein
MRVIISCIFLLLFVTPEAFAVNLIGRLGVGLNQQLPNNMSTISLKMQNSRSSAIGGFFGLDSGEQNTNYALGVKGYRIVYEEPQLNFYLGATAALFSFVDNNDDTSNGYILEGAFGTEFHLQGLESIGFSFEFGFGVHKESAGTSFKTIGHNTVVSAVHFYL